MPVWSIILISVIAGILLLLFVFAALCLKIAFGRRFDRDARLKYFTAEDFGLNAQPVAVSCGKTVLRGFVYSGATNNGKLIIFCHGMGAGHLAYTTEAAYFCKLGYRVLALDGRGCNLSDGKNVKGIYWGVKTAVAAYDYAVACAELAGAEIYFAGHSWGAYSALCASAKRKVKAVVAISAPDTPAATVCNGIAAVAGKPFAAVLKPFVWTVNFLTFGVNGNLSAAKCAGKNGALTLLIHGDKDKAVNKSNAAFYKARGENVTKLLCAGKAHNPYNTAAAEQRLAELQRALSGSAKTTEEQAEEFFAGFDFAAATEEDEEVMRKIAEFLENN